MARRPPTEEQQSALTRLVDEMLRSRKIGRPPIGQPLFGVYPETYKQGYFSNAAIAASPSSCVQEMLAIAWSMTVCTAQHV